MSRFPEIKPKKIIKILLSFGFVERDGKGSHIVFNHSDGRRTVVPNYKYPLQTGTVLAILRQAKISKKEFLELL